MAFTFVSWFFGLICEPDRMRREDPALYEDAEGNSTRGVILAEPQSFASFLSQLFSLLARSLGSSSHRHHPHPSLHLMGIQIPLGGDKRPCFVSRRAMEALAKAGPGPDPSPEEDCYICLRPVGTKNLPSTSGRVGRLSGGGGGGGVRQSFAESAESDENDESGTGEDAREKGCCPKAQHHHHHHQQQHGHDSEGECEDEPHPQREQQQQQRRQSSSSSSSSRSSALLLLPSILRLPCGHRFCDPCLRRWLSLHSNCPTCRWAFPERDCETVSKEF